MHHHLIIFGERVNNIQMRLVIFQYSSMVNFCFQIRELENRRKVLALLELSGKSDKVTINYSFECFKGNSSLIGKMSEISNWTIEIAIRLYLSKILI